MNPKQTNKISQDDKIEFFYFDNIIYLQHKIPNHKMSKILNKKYVIIFLKILKLINTDKKNYLNRNIFKIKSYIIKI